MYAGLPEEMRDYNTKAILFAHFAYKNFWRYVLVVLKTLVLDF